MGIRLGGYQESEPSGWTKAAQLINIWQSAAAQARQQRFEKNMMDAILKSSSPEELKINIGGVLDQGNKKRGILGNLLNEFNPRGTYTGGIDPSVALTLKKMMEPKEAETEEGLRYGMVPWTEDPRNANNPLAIAERERKIREAKEGETVEVTEDQQVKNYVKQAEKLENEIAGIEGVYGIENIDDVVERYDKLEKMTKENWKGVVEPKHWNPKLARQYEGVKLIKSKQAQAALLRRKAKEKMGKKGAEVKSEGKVRKLDKATALMILQEAGGDKERAREIARERGYDLSGK